MFDQLLLLLGGSFIVAMFLLILVPYLRGRADLVTPWTFFLAGSAIFVGWATVCLPSRTHYVRYDDGDYWKYMIGIVVFYTTLVITHSRVKVPRRLAGRVFLNWPPASARIVYCMLPIAGVFALGLLMPSRIVGVRQFFGLVGEPAMAFALALAFYAWCRQPANPLLLLTWSVLLIVVLALTVQVAFGRRLLVGTLMSLPVILYWVRGRYWRPISTLLMLGIATCGMLVVVLAFTQIRVSKSWREKPEERGMSTLKDMWSLISTGKFTGDSGLSSDTGECSLLAIRMYTRDLPPQPFHSLYFTVVNPMPRVFWPTKPMALGRLLPVKAHEVYGLPRPTSILTLGPGIVGHGYHEGGLFMLVFYGILFGTVLRFADEMVMRQSDNPYILAGFAAVCGHVLGWARGDIGVFGVNIIAGCILMLIVGWIGRLVYGTGLRYPRTSHLDVTRRGFVPTARAIAVPLRGRTTPLAQN